MSKYNERIKLHKKMSQICAGYKDIKTLLENAETKTMGWGENYITTMSDSKIFIKSLKITQKEYDNKFDTSNLFNLPTFYNYGIGSAGINVWRELSMHIKTTKYVIDNKCRNFPLLYHYRVMVGDPKRTIKYDAKYLKYWNSSKNIKKYLDEKNKTKYRLLLFLEYFPNVAYKYLPETKNIKSFYLQSMNIINFLNKKHILHFDAHLGNFLVDDSGNFYLSDFGLCIDKTYKLSDREVNFMTQNKKYDTYMICKDILNVLFDIVVQKNNIRYYEKKFNFEYTEKTTDEEIFYVVRDNYDGILEREKIKMDNMDDIIIDGIYFYEFLEKLKTGNKSGHAL